jgi:hypothetical protein
VNGEEREREEGMKDERRRKENKGRKFEARCVLNERVKIVKMGLNLKNVFFNYCPPTIVRPTNLSLSGEVPKVGCWRNFWGWLLWIDFF